MLNSQILPLGTRKIRAKILGSRVHEISVGLYDVLLKQRVVFEVDSPTDCRYQVFCGSGYENIEIHIGEQFLRDANYYT